MPNVYDIFGTNKEKEIDGIELDFGDFSITVARSGGKNTAFSNAFAKLLRNRQLRDGDLDEEIASKQLAELYADHVVLGWNNVCDREGKPIPFNKANCVKLLLDLPDLFRELRVESDRLANFRESEIKDAVKN